MRRAPEILREGGGERGRGEVEEGGGRRTYKIVHITKLALVHKLSKKYRIVSS